MSISALDALSPAQKEAVIRLPFRVGMWISQADRSGGGDSDTKEREALSTIVASYAEDYLKSEFVQRLMEMTLKRRAEWNDWTSNLEKVPFECKAVLKLLERHLPIKDVETLKYNLMDIGFAVAMAYRETSESNKNPVFGTFLETFMGFMGRLLGRTTEGMDENISPDEHRALMKLTEAMGIELKSGSGGG